MNLQNGSRSAPWIIVASWPWKERSRTTDSSYPTNPNDLHEGTKQSSERTVTRRRTFAAISSALGAGRKVCVLRGLNACTDLRGSPMTRTIAVFLCFLVAQAAPARADPLDLKTLAIGAPAPDFRLPGVDGKTYSLKDFAGARLLLVIFTCNHCPTAQAYDARLARLHANYGPRGVALVAISPNDPLAV